MVLGKTANDDKLIAALRKELVAATGGKAGCGRCAASLPALTNAAAACDSILPHTSPPASPGCCHSPATGNITCGSLQVARRVRRCWCCVRRQL